MRNKETVTGIASIFLGNGGAGVLAWFGQNILALIISIVFTITGVVLLVIAFRTKTSSEKYDSFLTIGAKAQGVRSYGYYDKAEGTGGKERDKEITVEAILSPSKPTTVSKISLELWGQKFDSETGMHIVETTMTLLLVFSHIPKELAINTNARICALSTDGSEIFSEPFPVNFEVEK